MFRRCAMFWAFCRWCFWAWVPVGSTAVLHRDRSRPSRRWSYAYGINASGQVVGTSDDKQRLLATPSSTAMGR